MKNQENLNVAELIWYLPTYTTYPTRYGTGTYNTENRNRVCRYGYGKVLGAGIHFSHKKIEVFIQSV